MAKTAKPSSGLLIVILAIEAFYWLLLMRMLLLLVTFKKIIYWFRLVRGNDKVECSIASAEKAIVLGWVVRSVAARLPGLYTCLAQSLAAMAMLRRRAIPGSLYLGVARNTPGATWPITAHAWLVSGDSIIIGANCEQHFTTIAEFHW